MLADALRAHPVGLDEAFALVDGLDDALVHGLARLDDDRAAALDALVAAFSATPLAERVTDAIGKIISGTVSDEHLAVRVGQELVGRDHFVALARRERDVERAALGVDDGVELCRKASSRAAQSVASDPPFPPDASWCARTMEPSTIEPVSSTSSCSSRKIVAQWPFRAQFAKRL